MDTEKIKQALEEAAWTFAAFFAITFLKLATGWGAGANLEEVRAAGIAAVIAGAGAAGKALLWYFTGTKVRKEGRNV
jgi:hypothetical protein